MIRDWLRNPWETAALAALLTLGLRSPYGIAAAALWFAGLEISAGLRGLEGPRWWPSWWPARDRPLTVLYDETCVLCTRSKGRLEAWPTARTMRFLPLQSQEARALVPGLEDQAYLGSMHVVEGGRVFSAHEGWYRIMSRGPIPAALGAALTPVWIAKPFYAWVARNRFRWFGRVCESGSCQVHPRRPPG